MTKAMAKFEKTPYINFVLEGKINYGFVHKPRAADELYDKPPMYVAELYDFKVVPQAGSPIKTLDDLKTYRISTRTYDLASDHKDYERLNDKKVVKFQTKIYGEEEDEIKANTEKKRPTVTDTRGNNIPSSVLVGNGSLVRIKGSLPDYTKVTPPPGRKPVTPTLDAVMVIDLVEYVPSEGTTVFTPDFKRIDPIEGGFVLGQAANTVDGDDDLFAGLETPEDLEPVVVTTTKKKRSA